VSSDCTIGEYIDAVAELLSNMHEDDVSQGYVIDYSTWISQIYGDKVVFAGIGIYRGKWRIALSEK